jgi:transposase-like protein
MRTYTDEEKKEILSMSRKIGVKKTSEETGVSEPTIYNWRAKQKKILEKKGKKIAQQASSLISAGLSLKETAVSLDCSLDFLKESLQKFEENDIDLLTKEMNTEIKELREKNKKLVEQKKMLKKMLDLALSKEFQECLEEL